MKAWYRFRKIRFHGKAAWWPWLAAPVLVYGLYRLLHLDISPAEFRSLLLSVSPWQLAGLAIFNLLVLLCFSSRWWIILQAMGWRMPYLATFRYRLAAFAISYFTPGPQMGGEPLQVYALKNRHGLAAASAAASITLDKLFELVANFSFLAIGLAVIFANRLATSPWQGAVIAWPGGMLLALLAYLVILAGGGRPFSRLATWLLVHALQWAKWGRSGNAAKANDLVRNTEDQAGHFLRHKPAALAGVLLSSAVIWLLSLGEYWLALRVFGAHLNPVQVIVALTAARLAFLTPLPGGLGALEAGQMLAMQSLGFSPALGLAISLWIRIRDIGIAMLGFWMGAGLLLARSAEPGEALAVQVVEASDPFIHIHRK
jgi:glycosyltransferase 2 family protein